MELLETDVEKLSVFFGMDADRSSRGPKGTLGESDAYGMIDTFRRVRMDTIIIST